ncbi:hypothetical protein FBU30_001188 [Linnemannia zychae]|nr:hypothetical protein FBU30_001188 [Linnemannia zychae]
MTQKAVALTLLAALGCLTINTFAQTRESQIAIIDMAGIYGTFTFSPLPDTQTTIGGANVVIDIERGLTRQTAKLPNVGFEYHIHMKQVGAGNNCEATGGHLDDPLKPGVYPCDSSDPDKCQEGDLSGKHDNLPWTETGALTLRYIDKQLKFTGDATTVAGRSLVIHNNGTRIACANILPHSEQRPANGLPLPQQSQPNPNQRQQGGSGGQSSVSNPSSANGNNSRLSSDGHASDGRFGSSEAIWTVIGSVTCGVIAALIAF